MYLIRCGHFPSRDKDGGYTIRSAIAENPMLYANYTALTSIVITMIKVLYFLETVILALFCSHDLDFDPMTFKYELDLYLLKMYPQTEKRFYVKAFESCVLYTDRHR